MKRFPLEAIDEIAAQIGSTDRCVLFLDYDGTLTPLVDDPAAACLTGEMRGFLAALTRRPGYNLAIVSGRSVADLGRLVRVKGIFLAGNHGLEIIGPGVAYVHPGAAERQPTLHTLAQTLCSRLQAIEGALVEDNEVHPEHPLPASAQGVGRGGREAMHEDPGSFPGGRAYHVEKGEGGPGGEAQRGMDEGRCRNVDLASP